MAAVMILQGYLRQQTNSNEVKIMEHGEKQYYSCR